MFIKTTYQEANNMGVSFIIASYNCVKYIDECLQSIYQQTYNGDIEIIVCDDCSTDGTRELLEQYSCKGKLILIKNKTNLGAAQSRNNCISLAKHNYLAILDADDYISKDRIEKQIAVLEKNNEIDFVSTGIQRFYEDGERINFIPQKEYPEAKDFLFTLPFSHATTLFRKDILQRVGGYRIAKETRRGQDYDLFMRIYAAGGKGCNIPDITYFYRCFRGSNKKKDSYSIRIDEAKIRAKGFKAMGIGPIRYLYILKPLILGLIPNSIIDKLWHKGG